MQKLFFTIFLVGCCFSPFSQILFTNNGSDIFVKDGAFMIVKTSALENKLVSGNGLIENNGTIVVEGDITNNGNIIANGDTIRLSGNWINNLLYNGANSWVEMNGGAQEISGIAITTFHHLNLLGGVTTKRQTLNAIVEGKLFLNDAELATDVNDMLIRNPLPDAISRSSGFVSSVGNGKLARATNSTSSYLFPTGSPSYINSPSIFRPVEFVPAATTTNIYGAMVIKGDASNDNFNIAELDEFLCKVNPNFYHKLYHVFGSTPAGLTMFFNPSVDDDWTDQAHWDIPNRWNYIGSSIQGNSMGFSTVTVNNVADYTPEPFALSRRGPLVNAGPDITIVQGQSTVFNPFVSASPFYDIFWSPDVSLSCATCENPTASPASTTVYTIRVVDDEGCAVKDQVKVNVTQAELLIPTAFSPNGDGVNDLFRILNSRVSKYNMQVYNRWGEKLFETNDPREGWDGIYLGIEQELGVYVWQCTYRLEGSSLSQTAKGNVTLIR